MDRQHEAKMYPVLGLQDPATEQDTPTPAARDREAGLLQDDSSSPQATPAST